METASGRGWAGDATYVSELPNLLHFVGFRFCLLRRECSAETQPDLVDSMTKGLAGNIGSQAVEDQVPAGGARGDGAVIGVE